MLILDLIQQMKKNMLSVVTAQIDAVSEGILAHT